MTADVPAAPALRPDPELTARLAALSAAHDVPALLAAVVRDGEVRVAWHGVTDVTAPRPVDADTLIAIGSTTKTLTAAALAALIDPTAPVIDRSVPQGGRDRSSSAPVVDRSVPQGGRDRSSSAPVVDRSVPQGGQGRSSTAAVVDRSVPQGGQDRSTTGIGLDTPVAALLPDLPLPAGAEAVRVGHLLDHTAGWQGDVADPDRWGDDALGGFLAEVLPQLPQLTPPGAVVSYSNTAVALAGLILARLHGGTYEEAVTALVLEPLGMTATHLLPWTCHGRPVAVGHVAGPQGLQPVHRWGLSRALGPAGAAVSTLTDQVRWLRWCLDGHVEVGARRPLADGVRLALQQPRTTCRSGLTGTGVGWLLRRRHGVDLVTHGGNVSGHTISTFDLAPSLGLGVTVLGTAVGARLAGASLLDEVLADAGVHVTASPDRRPRTAATRTHPHGRDPGTQRREPTRTVGDLGTERREPARAAGELTTERRGPTRTGGDLAPDAVGVYDAGQWLLELSLVDGVPHLARRLPDVPGVTEDLRRRFDHPPRPLLVVGEDQLADPDDPAEPAADLIRDPGGAVAFLRHGLRLARGLPHHPTEGAP